EALAATGPPVLPALLERLADGREDERVRAGIIQAIEAMKPPAKVAVPTLVMVITQEQEFPRLRGLAARCLGEMGADAADAIHALVHLLTRPRSQVYDDTCQD